MRAGRERSIGHAACLTARMCLGLPMDDDLVMANPLEEPYEHFLRRQREAFGRETEAIT